MVAAHVLKPTLEGAEQSDRRLAGIKVAVVRLQVILDMFSKYQLELYLLQ
jgi:hypothetical protein